MNDIPNTEFAKAHEVLAVDPAALEGTVAVDPTEEGEVEVAGQVQDTQYGEGPID